ncbi:hypothetical protein [Paracoccus sp. (in: a-proteobacteria)]|uniref:hypothetical protein n=1 Tax=Paracoccus sp. TaxID=267 RepID=UPI0028A6374A|nr:hypothetical protein [Paracoccus sp. (in: a-proteobacteria)]
MTKLAQEIQPPLIWEGASLPVTKQASEVLLWQGALYRWDGTKYTASVEAVNIDGQVIADQIATDAVTPSKLSVVPGYNLIPDPNITDPAAWRSPHPTRWATEPGKITFLGTVAGTTAYYAKIFPITQGYTYRARATATKVAGPDTLVTIRIRFLDVLGNLLTENTAGGVTLTDGAAVVLQRSVNYPAGTAQLEVGLQLAGAVGGIVDFTALEAIHVNTSDTIADSAITTAKIVNDAINAAKIANNAVEAAKIAAGAVTETKISDNAITTPKIVAGAIETSKIAVTADKIAANAITVGKIAAGAVGADQIAANAIAARHLLVADFTNLVPNADIADAPSWTIPSPWVRVLSGPSARSEYWLYLDVGAGETGNSPTVVSQPFSVEVGVEYFAQIQSRVSSSGDTGHAIASVQWYDGSGTSLGFSTFANTAVTVSLASYSATVTPPAGAVRGTFRAAVNRGNSNGRVIISSPEVRRKNGGNLIVDGAITANKLAVDSVTANAIAAGAIVASAIAAGAVTAAAIAASAVTTIKLAAGAVTADKITVANLAALGITVGSADIATAAITSAKIADLSVGTIKIANNAISTYRQAYTAGATSLIVPTSGEFVQTFNVTPGRTGPLSIDVQIQNDLGPLDGRLVLYKNGSAAVSWEMPGTSTYYTNQWFDTSSTAGVAAQYQLYYQNTSGSNRRIKGRLIGCLDIVK